ncbi:hypothetical protein CEXT_106741 [Caerostris extrusa]|uniref:Uncharacterized protein n=1 Tax=Caerostris extrusa TaxID=172846 RepID=A0AAV4NN26_CAEEX|nr:hypothetical protein CEXT_106741 [Caerostris extrusa]
MKGDTEQLQIGDNVHVEMLLCLPNCTPCGTSTRGSWAQWAAGCAAWYPRPPPTPPFSPSSPSARSGTSPSATPCTSRRDPGCPTPSATSPPSGSSLPFAPSPTPSSRRSTSSSTPTPKSPCPSPSGAASPSTSPSDSGVADAVLYLHLLRATCVRDHCPVRAHSPGPASLEESAQVHVGERTVQGREGKVQGTVTESRHKDAG